jgi:hypothetical protein
MNQKSERPSPSQPLNDTKAIKVLEIIFYLMLAALYSFFNWCYMHLGTEKFFKLW